MRADFNVLLATVVFRMFNRIPTGEAIFKQPYLGPGCYATAWDFFVDDNDTERLKQSIVNYVGPKGPYVTGSYIIQSPKGYKKLDGVLKIIEMFINGQLKNERKSEGWKPVAEEMLNNPYSLEDTSNWLMNFLFIGHFTAYEIVSDLRHTDLLCKAPDIMTWANAGPGATRGLNVLHGRPLGSYKKHQMVEEMQELLELSRKTRHWPQTGDNGDIPMSSLKRWPAWEMREVEHWLCEYFKYWRMKTTGQVPRGRFHHG